MSPAKKSAMTNEEIIEAYDRILGMQEFKDKEFVFGFCSQLLANIFALSSEPEKLKQQFWLAAFGKVGYVADELQKKFKDEQFLKAITDRRLKIRSKIVHDYFDSTKKKA